LNVIEIVFDRVHVISLGPQQPPQIPPKNKIKH
jgi:hypothetical protein